MSQKEFSSQQTNIILEFSLWFIAVNVVRFTRFKSVLTLLQCQCITEGFIHYIQSNADSLITNCQTFRKHKLHIVKNETRTMLSTAVICGSAVKCFERVMTLRDQISFWLHGCWMPFFSPNVAQPNVHSSLVSSMRFRPKMAPNRKLLLLPQYLLPLCQSCVLRELRHSLRDQYSLVTTADFHKAAKHNNLLSMKFLPR